jgi:hypothetical protein
MRAAGARHGHSPAGGPLRRFGRDGRRSPVGTDGHPTDDGHRSADAGRRSADADHWSRDDRDDRDDRNTNGVRCSLLDRRPRDGRFDLRTGAAHPSRDGTDGRHSWDGQSGCHTTVAHRPGRCRYGRDGLHGDDAHRSTDGRFGHRTGDDHRSRDGTAGPLTRDARHGHRTSDAHHRRDGPNDLDGHRTGDDHPSQDGTADHRSRDGTAGPLTRDARHGHQTSDAHHRRDGPNDPDGHRTGDDHPSQDGTADHPSQDGTNDHPSQDGTNAHPRRFGRRTTVDPSGHRTCDGQHQGGQLTQAGTHGRPRDGLLVIQRGPSARRTSDAHRCQHGRADHRTSVHRMPADPTDLGNRTEHPHRVTARQDDGEPPSRPTNGSPSDPPSERRTAASPQNVRPSAAQLRRRTGRPAPARRTAARTSAHRWPSSGRWRDQARRPSTAVSLCPRPVADVHRRCWRARDRAPPGCDPSPTDLRHCLPGAILGRHCSSEEIPSSFCKLYGLIPAPPCAPRLSRSDPRIAATGIALLPRSCHAGVRSQLGLAVPEVVATDATSTRRSTNRKSHPVRDGSF